MKTKVLFILFITCCFTCSGQLKPSELILKNGDTITRIIGKLKRNTFKYKTHYQAKSEKINFSEIELLQIRYSQDDIKTYKFLPLSNKEELTVLQAINIGGMVELYGQFVNSNVVVAGGHNFPVTSIKYYLKKKEEDEMTEIGIYDPVFSKFKDKVREYFSDCPALLEEIESKNLKFRDGLEEMVKYYNTICNPA